LGFAWLDVFKSNTVLLSPCHQGPADILWAVVDANGLGFAAPLDDPVEAANNAFRRQREVDFDAQALSIEVVLARLCTIF